jgi:hypothetical protein
VRGEAANVEVADVEVADVEAPDAKVECRKGRDRNQEWDAQPASR